MKISAVSHHVHRGQLPHVSPVPGKLKLFIFVCNIGLISGSLAFAPVAEILNLVRVSYDSSSSVFFCELFCYNPLIYTYTCILT